MTEVTIRGPFSRERVPFETQGPSRTKQSHKKECDVNEILRKFRDQGVISHRNRFEGDYGDFTSVPSSYHDAMNHLRDAEEMFLSIPAHVREKFANDPGRFLDFVQNPANAQEMYDLGLSNSPPPKPAEQPSDDAGASSPAPEEGDTPS